MSSIVSRSTWGARYRNGVGTRKVGNLEKYLHHTVTAHLSENATVAQERAQMRILEQIGQQRFGGGISYTFLIFPSGRIYEGASVNRISYHSGAGRNTRGAGISLAGNFEANKLNAKAFNAVVWLLQEGVRKGWWGDPALTSYHQQFRSTACPGKHAISRFGAINSAGRGAKVAAAAKVGPNVKPKDTTPVVMRTNKADVDVHSHRDSSGKRKVSEIGSEGYHVNVVEDPKGSWTRIRWKVDGKFGNYWVASADLTKADPNRGKTSTAKAPSSTGEWPKVALRVDGDFGSVSAKAYQRLLAPKGVGDYRGKVDGSFGSVSAKAEQRWLRNLGLYKGTIDGDRGPRTIKALQNFLSGRGFYRGYIDGDFGPRTVRALQNYLNTQRKYYS